MKLLLVLILVELAFFVWSLVTKCVHAKEKTVARGGVLLLFIILLLTGVLEWGAQYYAISLVLAAQLIFGVIAWRQGKEKLYKTKHRVLCFFAGILLYAAALFPAILFPKFTLPAPTGDLSVAVADYTWVDENRVETFTETGEKRALTIRVWYPEKAEGKYPLVVFSHGAFGTIDSNISACMDLASNGYVVVSIAHPCHAAYVEDVNGKVTIANLDFVNSIYAANAANDESASYTLSRPWMKLRVDDENFVLDTLLEKAAGAEAPFSLVDTNKIGLFGHSMGGASSAQLGRERGDIDAVLILEGTMFGEYVGVKDGVGVYVDEPYPVPLLDVYSAQVFDLLKAYPREDYTNFYAGDRAACYGTVVFNGAGHLNFTDLPLFSPLLARLLGVGTVDPRACIEDVNHVVLTFFNSYLKEGDTPNLQKEYGS